jgi:LmbE family N-acetylglucosaminyl deacetylase
MHRLLPLLGRTLVIVAHPDDEAVGCGGLIQRMRDPFVLFCTDGAPRDPYFWQKFGCREEYARRRREEARRALAHVGVTRFDFLPPEPNPDQLFVDQDLFLNVRAALGRIGELVTRLRPEALLTLAYEGGHPDHDTCAFLAWCTSREFVLPAWEIPLYHREADGRMEKQCFMVPEGDEVLFDAMPEEVTRKRRMLDEYITQKETIDMFNPAIERFRPQAAYDFSKPPHPGTLNYEAWGWPMTGAQVIQSFQCCSKKSSNREPDPKDPGSAIRGFA